MGRKSRLQKRIEGYIFLIGFIIGVFALDIYSISLLATGNFFNVFEGGLIAFPIIAWLLTIGVIVWGIVSMVNSDRRFYPQLTIEYNISNKRKISANAMIDNWIIQNGVEPVEKHIAEIEQWKKDKIKKFKGNAKKIEKFNARCLENCNKAFRFVSYRMQTRYQQINYQKHAYQVRVDNEDVCISEKAILERIEFLKKHNFNVTFNQYHAVDQRKVLTKAMREQVKKRDNWTCQICGKVMRDEVGLQIDHITPISRGGKSILDNLRVTCSKCNLGRGNKLDDDDSDYYEKDELF